MEEKVEGVERGEYVIGIALILAALLVSATVYFGMSNIEKTVNGLKLSAPAGTVAAAAAAKAPVGAAALSEAALTDKIEKYVQANLLSNQSLTAKVVKIVPYDASLDLVTMEVVKGTQTVQSGIELYATKDGATIMLGGQVFDTSAPIQKNTPSQQQPAAPAQPAVKADKPKAQAFIMSLCPYGLQFMKAYVPVMELLGNKADISIDFVSYAMHGKKEVEGNNYLYCVQKDSKAKFPAYVRCYVENGDYQGCLATSGIDANKTATCVSSLDKQYNITGLFNDKSTWLSGTYPIYPVEAGLNTQYSVGGSPTFVLNGAQFDVARSPDAIKAAICSSFKTQPAECNTTLSKASEAAGLGKVGSGTTNGGAAAANCGN